MLLSEVKLPTTQNIQGVHSEGGGLKHIITDLELNQ